MDGYQKTNKPGLFGSQFSQGQQQRPPVSQSDPSHAQNQGSQGPSQRIQGSDPQGTASYPQGRGPLASPVGSRGQATPAYQQPISQGHDNGPSQAQAPSDARQVGAQGRQVPPSPMPSAGNQRVPSISRRRYIKWSMVANHSKDEEDTETFVLTEPQSALFVDVRFLKSTLRDVQPGNPALLEPEQIDWAFAGTTESTPLGPDKAPYHRQVKFVHWIDSRSLNPEDIFDNAYIYSPNDGSTDEIEVGSMINPHTGDKQGYEERWSDEEVFSASGQGPRLCIAMTTEQADGTRGCVMVLGQWAQGVMRTGQGTLHIERWCSTAANNGGGQISGRQQAQTTPNAYPSPQPSHVGTPDENGSGWHLIARVGVPILPSPASFVNKDLTPGTICQVSGMSWHVRAVRTW